MITHHVDQTNHILEVTIDGHISREELQKTIKEFEGPLNDWADIRVLKRIDSFKGMEMQAWVDDFNFAYKNMGNYKKISKIAIVTDKEWVQNVVGVTKYIAPGEVRVFENEDIDEARSWLR